MSACEITGRIALGPEVRITQLDDTVELRLVGDWRLAAKRPAAAEVAAALASDGPVRRVSYQTGELTAWDTSLLLFLDDVAGLARGASIDVDPSGLPEGVQRLVALSRAVPKKEAGEEAGRLPAVDRLGGAILARWGRFGDAVEFIGETTLAFGRLFKNGPQFRRADLLQLTQQAGAEALGIVSLVSALLGLILAFVGAQQLRQFGATIYVADLVGVAMVRDMAALMTAIVIAGRTGAAYAAQLGIMSANQEIDALATMGIRPVDYLVVPRMIALCSMMPFLVLFSDFVGILGGALSAVALMGVSWSEYWQQTSSAVSMDHVIGGVFKGSVYGALVAFAGCYHGIRAERSSMGVGAAATSAVVTGIIAIIAACGLFQILFDVLGI